MNWKLILQLSLFGLAMGAATISLVPTNVEPFFWLVILLFCGRMIAVRGNGKPFLHGLCLGLVNCVWVTGAHILFFETYLANHAREAAMMSSMPMPDSPRLMMAMTGPVVGVVSGVVIGVVAMVFARFSGPPGRQ